VKKYSHESKMCLLELVAERLAKDSEPLDTPIQSFEQITSPKPKDIVSSPDFPIDEPFVDKHKSDVEQLQSRSDMEDTDEKLVHVKVLKEYPENQQIDHLFFWPERMYFLLKLLSKYLDKPNSTLHTVRGQIFAHLSIKLLHKCKG